MEKNGAFWRSGIFILLFYILAILREEEDFEAEQKYLVYFLLGGGLLKDRYELFLSKSNLGPEGYWNIDH